MAPEIAVYIATFVIVFVLLGRDGAARPTGIEVDPDVARARDLIRRKIDEHGGMLARRYLEACEQEGHRMTGDFAREIEGFIGTVLLPELQHEHPDLGRALREVMTLERERIYELVLARVQAP